MILLVVALAPVFIIAFYIYFRDKYEKEPIGILIKSFVAGAVITAPILFIELYLSNYWEQKFSNNMPDLSTAAYSAFVVAAFSEELFKYAAFILLIWKNKNFNEKFDGIVYATFISLGFAAVENILYVLQNGMATGLLRAITAVPAHAIFGITMGFYLGFAKMIPHNKTLNMILALIIPIILHGIYDFILMSENEILLILFIPFVIFMWVLGFRKMKKHINKSPFKNEQFLT